ncbi:MULTISPECIES: hypothetical protein [Bacillus]|uniref:Uncharacterized protein n=1 Tax=Bacillus thuringiensis T01-328 TaxID=1324966 RepID=A0AAN4HKI5_BACTU|nr:MULTISPECIES: hypothetical protein [Bacillus]MCU5279445.1 hypothetical protein [Bacillus cereus]AFV21490.1 hypothetical protein BTB_502p01540 [Bacillus thuringiensis Bt407]EEM25475.1 hypothetical protein bthur0002_61180 [Bacillus thuringiensis Bt407]ERI01334.1 hypothetical protein BTCBT_002922 [Bacillus thuringiensis T01-328]MEC0048089.1 hypothetical protein [Bacillus cereus]
MNEVLEPITEQKEIFKVELWLLQLKTWLECEAEIQPPDVTGVYLKQAKEIQDFLDSRE